MSDIDLRLGNCLELMKDIPDGSIEAIITDPPYGTTACKWDSVIPFNKHIKIKNKTYYLDDYILLEIKEGNLYKDIVSHFNDNCELGMWEQLNRIIKPNGAIVLFGSEPFSSALRMSNIKNYKYDWIWEKSKVGNIFNCKNAPQKNYETISVFSFGNIANGSKIRMEYNPQGLKEINKERSNASKGRDGKTIGIRPSRMDNSTYIQTKTNYPKQILKFNNEQGKHPTQKPVGLMEYLIKTYTNENETVLDFTMGSGTTLVACQNTNRNGIGIEMDENYFKIAQNRVKGNKIKLEGQLLPL